MAIFTAELAKRDKYYATLDLPADKRQLQNAKWQARFSGEADESVSFALGSRFPDLEFPEMSGDRLDEINYLAHRIDSMSEDELTAYKALLTTIEGTAPDMKTMINMTYGLDRIIVSPATDFHMLGEHYIDNDLLPELEGIPESAVPFIDREAVGKLIAERNEGMFIDGMYVEIGDYVVPEEYDGEHIPDAESGDIRISLINRDTGMINSFQFPVDPDTLKQITEKYDLEQIFDITDSSGNIRAGMIKSAADLDALNSLAEKLNAMTDEESIVFSAVMQSEDPATIDAMLDIAEHIGEYELDRDAMCYDNFGKEYLEAFLPADFDTELLAKLAATGFGEAVASKIGATITDYGMISERGRQLSEMVYKEDKLPIIFDDAEETSEQNEQADGGMEEHPTDEEPEPPTESAPADPVPEDEPTELFADPDEDIPGFDPFPDDYPEAYFTLDESDGSDYDVPLPEDLLDFDPALVDYDEDDTLYYSMT